MVDAVVFIQDRLVPIDSKFPLENFRRAREVEDEGERRRAKQQFDRDVRKHVDTIADKYIRPASGTCDFALMYVPAEAVYAEIAADGEEGGARRLRGDAPCHSRLAASPLRVPVDRGARPARHRAAGERPRGAPAISPISPRLWDRVTAPARQARRSSRERPEAVRGDDRAPSTASRRASRRSPSRSPTRTRFRAARFRIGRSLLLPPS